MDPVVALFRGGPDTCHVAVHVFSYLKFIRSVDVVGILASSKCDLPK